MAGNTFGHLFRVTTFGESHGPAVGAIVDGCPPRLPLTEKTIQEMTDRRRPGVGPAGTPRKEPDIPRILSGVFEGRTTGTPIAVVVENRNANPGAYAPYADLFRPGHGDITYQRKYGIRDYRGGGRASARETAARVAAGAVAKAVLTDAGVTVTSHTAALGGIPAKVIAPNAVSRNPYCCPDPAAAVEMDARVRAVRSAGDSIGGIVAVTAKGVPPGLGEPVFDKLDADLAKGLMSIGAVKGVEVGAGFSAAARLGSENNDAITPSGFDTNNAGGVLAGISNGDEIHIRVAVKPIPSITIEQNTVDLAGNPVTVSVKGRHDVSAIPRINVVCEAMVLIVLADHLLRRRAMA
jgi:chorismate synthase